MSETPNNPSSPDPQPGPAQSPWIYSPIPTPLSASKPVAPVTPPAPPPPVTKQQVAPPAPAPTAKEKPSDSSLAGVIDTIEAIIIALVIALAFRAFIVEAFVIPTGSMAPTLLGAHFKVVCPKCGYDFDLEGKVSLQLQGAGGKYYVPIDQDQAAELRDNTKVPLNPSGEAADIICPNCRYLIPPKDLPQPLPSADLPHGQGGPLSRFHFAWANNGDRILVLKYLYAVTEPKRWDVIVFKEPVAAQTNYIKRCIGLPFETIQIVNGDIFVGGPEAASRQIARKPEELQQFLWQLVYDNDYYPIDESKTPLDGGWVNPWQASPMESARDWKRGTTMRYEGKTPGALSFNLTPSRAPNLVPYTLNTLGYNGDFVPSESPMVEFTPRAIVGDLRMETTWSPADTAAASIQLTLGRPNNCFQITWDAKGPRLSKFNQATSAFEPVTPAIAVAGAPVPAPGNAYRLSFNNVDRAVQFLVDGKTVLSYQEPWTAAQAIQEEADHPAEWSNPIRGDEHKDRANSMIRIDVAGACTMSHLKLFRDLYYTEMTQGPGTGTKDHPITLGADEFFALGDNSRRSADGRMWSRVHDPLGDLGLRPGLVPRRYLLGKAFFVYWPAGFRPTDNPNIPFKLNNLPLVPNTGDMRIIR